MKTKLVGILNITPDSFSDGGKYNSLNSALFQVERMIKEGAKVIDIGAESTRPTATPITPQEEWSRLEKILPQIVDLVKKLSPEVKTSIDSYHFETLKKSHEVGVDIINDVKGLSDERIVEFIAERNIETILMHCNKVSSVADALVNKNINLIGEMLSWFEEKISYLQKRGVKKSQLVLDPGVGFNKDALQSIRILKNIEKFQIFDLPIYVGHSKKSFLEAVKIEGDRAQKTLVISKYLAAKGVDYLRIHDVKENLSAITL